ncbi:MAG: MetQ/NlpA family ABC transporter substrate-binding protein [Thermoanaerobacteraceae bacterium]|nr:MetQ/NlpA family ABC transporter substrate-binding protein [Thermoanaerobacteraceae bacterium]
MKRIVLLGLVFILVIGLVSGCGSSNTQPAGQPQNQPAQGQEEITLKVGATPVPHAEILEFVKPMLKEKGINLEIVEFTDYVQPNKALDEGSIDANFFQHVPYMDEFAKNNNMELVALVKVHVEPMGVYSKKIKSLDELKDGATISIPNDPTNEGRALLLLQKNGLIKLKDSASLTATPVDIAENPKNLKFSELDAAQLPRTLQDVDASVINTNFALEAGLNPLKDAIAIEDKDSPYANVLTVRPDNKDDQAIKTLGEVLNSPEVKKFIEDKYQGAIVPAF